MPRATASVEETTRVELKTCPGGFVELRKMTYGQILHRRSMSANMKIETGGKGKDLAGELALMNRKVTEYEFANCIVTHNLEDETGRTLDFNNPRDIEKLDPKVGAEIDQAITEMNQPPDDEGNS